MLMSETIRRAEEKRVEADKHYFEQIARAVQRGVAKAFGG